MQNERPNWKFEKDPDQSDFVFWHRMENKDIQKVLKKRKCILNRYPHIRQLCNKETFSKIMSIAMD